LRFGNRLPCLSQVCTETCSLHGSLTSATTLRVR